MESKTTSSPLGRAAIAVGLLIVLPSLFLGPAWGGIIFGLLVTAVGLAAGVRIER